ncbi:Gfo/Idh/MocA family protein [Mangrovibacterium diazotrophicum]|uniref:Oxidoreductase family protein n=1 Tax=Mangrovibacterium diazotrophicum TaxID=1261403 RepID=A0A419VW41_9BACT|nr:Gfo/Idh/MocA family oxidoreductase [Mangrovibacterium diazotrophicum]RKD86374.1 oxidoreductase family protein [Mangrovibacterium diazotrophicum]
MKRRNFLATTGAAIAGSVIANPAFAINTSKSKKRLALIGTGYRGTMFWGKSIIARYKDLVEFVALCDINIGRLETAKKYLGINCSVFTDFDEMVATAKPDMIIITTVDSTHHEFIIKGLEYGLEVVTEKPLTTDEDSCQAILDAEKRTGNKVIVGFNYRYGPHPTKIKELLTLNTVGKITSVDFHWYLNTYHGASYFRRWNGEKDKSGTLLVHKSTHHFDLINWLLDSDPVEVFAYGSLEHYGRNNSFRGSNCRNCAYVSKCKFYWDINEDPVAVDLYAKNEKYDGYIRDNCLWREEIDIYDKMAVQIKYANNVQVSYSLTTYSPYEGWRMALNGTDGRIDSWKDIPWRTQEQINQGNLHDQEMKQGEKDLEDQYDEVMVMKNWEGYQQYKITKAGGGHGGGDERLLDKIFLDPNAADPFKHSAGSRDGAMSILIGIAARKSIEEKRPVRIDELTDIKPHPTRGV